ncbi:MAG: efflux RND transporter permease subunit [Vampirovibrionales bacterium]
MFSDYFIKRPILASVIAAAMVLIGAIAALFLPVQQYPDIAPPKVTVTAVYNGANAESVEAAVTTPLEQEINGVEGMKYIQSSSSNDGVALINVAFDHGIDPDKAVMNIKNRVDAALGRLPQEVKATGIQVEKESDAFIMGLAFFSPNGKYSHEFISNYVERNVVEKLNRIKGLAKINMFGARKYAMRLWLNPLKLSARHLSVGDVVHALQEQNMTFPAGQLGALPQKVSLDYQLPVLVEGRLKDTQAFNQLVLKRTPNGGIIRLADVGHAELGAEDYAKTVRWTGYNSVGFGVRQLPGTNALQLASQLRSTLEKLKTKFPEGLTYEVGFDPTSFIDQSIKEVRKTLLEAIICVVAVIFLFLQNWRTTIIPTLTIPVSLVGTFAIMQLFGFSINLLTMFGLILATGVVVDDAIVVIENIARQLEEDPSISPLEAASKGMKEVFGAVIATALVLIAVFVPVAFFPGTTGLMYQQFALTIAFSVAISAFNAITLTPALSALFLKAQAHGAKNLFFVWVDGIIQAFTALYQHALRLTLQLRPLAMLIFAGLLVLTGVLFLSTPKGFVPTEDQGYFIILAQAPEGTSHDYMKRVIERVEKLIAPIKEVNGVFAINGFSFTGNAPNRGLMFVPLKSIEARPHHHQSASAIIEKLRGPLMSIPEAFVLPIEPPAVPGIGNMGGFDFYLQERTGTLPLDELAGAQYQLVGSAPKQTQALGQLIPTFDSNAPLLKMEVLRDVATSMGLSVAEVMQTVQVFLGSSYVNDFTFENRSYRVYAQAEDTFRRSPDALSQFYVRNLTGQMVPLKSVAKFTETTGPQIIPHYNLFRSAQILGAPRPGVSSGDAITAMESLTQQLPNAFGFEWSGLYQEQKESGGQTLLFLGLGIMFVYLVLAAQYESWIDPFIIVLSVPLAMLGALLAINLRGMDNNVFTQVGMILLIGLASKNAILIVEFANHLRQQGKGLIEAAREAAILRFRPIVMTSLAFIIGVIPLVFAEGAGAAARQVIGTAVFGGMLLSTILSLLIVPVQYIVIHALFDRWVKPKTVPTA